MLLHLVVSVQKEALILLKKVLKTIKDYMEFTEQADISKM